MFFVFLGRFPLIFGLASYPPGPILESAFLCRVSVDRNLRLVTHFKFLFLGPDQKMVTKRPENWPPGLILGAFCTIFRARPVGAGLGAKFGRKPAKNQMHIIISIKYSNVPDVSAHFLLLLVGDLVSGP